jgi:tetratricopeptide (TPR) repeat protein
MFTLDLPYKVKIIKRIMKFSIVILTKNDSENLSTLLNSLVEFKNCGGEVCIIDIGSTDNTLEIANDWGCKIDNGTIYLRNIDNDMVNIINEKFDNLINNTDNYFDYSGLKNYAASIVSNDMLFIINANINLINFDIQDIQNYIDAGYDLINFETLDNNIINSIYNRQKFNWENIVCEKLIKITPDETKEIFTQSLKILSLNNKNFTENDREMLVGLVISCFLNPTDRFMNQKLLYELNNNYANFTLKELDRQLNIYDDIEKCKLLVDYGDLLLRKNNDDLAIEYYHKAYLICSKLRLPLYKLGQYYYNKKIWDRCIFYLEGCLNIPKTDMSDDDFMYKDGPYSMLYVAWWWNGDIKKGKYYFDKAIEIDPHNILYIEESIYHYNYKGNNIDGNETFQQLQFLYNNGIKYNSILEVYPNARSTEALLSSTNNIVTVIRKSECNCFILGLDNPGNLKIMYTIEESINYFEKENIKFDMIVLHNYNDIIQDYNDFWFIRIWEKFANKLLCGFDYIENKKMIDDTFEISGVTDNIWYKNISSFEKTTIYKKKN